MIADRGRLSSRDPAEKPASNGNISWTDPEIRKLLRQLRRPHQLNDNPIAHALCSAFGVKQPYRAVLALIRRTFENKGAHALQLQRLIETCDVDGLKSQAEVAAEMGISIRQFFRFRGEAVRALRTEVEMTVSHEESASGFARLAACMSEHNPAVALQIYDLLPTRYQTDELAAVSAILASGQAVGDADLANLTGVSRKIALARISQSCFMRGQRDEGKVILDSLLEDARSSNVLEYELLLAGFVLSYNYESQENVLAAASRLRKFTLDAHHDQAFEAILAVLAAHLLVGKLDLAFDLLNVARQSLPRWRPHFARALVYHEALFTFLAGQGGAEDLIRAAELASGNFPYEDLAYATLSARIAELRGSIWRSKMPVDRAFAPAILTPTRKSGPLRLAASFDRSYARQQYDILRLRMYLRNRPLSGTELQYLQCLNVESPFPRIVPFAKATLGIACATENRADEAQQLLLGSWERYLQDPALETGFDLFVHVRIPERAFGIVEPDAQFHAIIDRYLLRRYPMLGPNLGSLSGTLWSSIAVEAFRGDARIIEPPMSAQVMEQLSDEALRALVVRHKHSIGRELGDALSILLPQAERKRFTQRFANLVSGFFQPLHTSTSL